MTYYIDTNGDEVMESGIHDNPWCTIQMVLITAAANNSKFIAVSAPREQGRRDYRGQDWWLVQV